MSFCSSIDCTGVLDRLFTGVAEGVPSGVFSGVEVLIKLFTFSISSARACSASSYSCLALTEPHSGSEPFCHRSNNAAMPSFRRLRLSPWMAARSASSRLKSICCTYTCSSASSSSSSSLRVFSHCFMYCSCSSVSSALYFWSADMSSAFASLTSFFSISRRASCIFFSSA